MRDKRLATAVATFLTAFAVAHLMQFGLSVGRAIPSALDGLSAGVAPTAQVMPKGPSAFPRPPAAALAPPAIGARPVRLKLLAKHSPRPLSLPEETRSAFGLSCVRQFAAHPDGDGWVRLRLHAPCDPFVRVEIVHAGLRFAVPAGGDGTLDLRLPALAVDAAFAARFDGGPELRASVVVPEAARLDRAVLVTEGAGGLALGETGHRGAGLRLGDPTLFAPVLAEVRPLPSDIEDHPLRIEAEVTPATCGRDLAGEIVRVRAGRAEPPVRVSLSMPGCEAEGEVLVLDVPAAGVAVANALAAP